MPKKLVSACLLGERCRYNGKGKPNQELISLSNKNELIPVCPDILGGLTTPRSPAEIVGGTGRDVLEGRAKVMSKDGRDVTGYFVKGAYAALEIAKKENATEAYLKSKSPSCGCGKIYDGTFSGKLKDGDGVTAALLKKNGIKVKAVTQDDG